MKKLLLAVLGLCISSCVFAEIFRPKVNYIKRIYEESIRLGSGGTTYNPHFYLKYFDSNIRKIYERDDEYQKATGGIACIDYDVLWQGQDLDPNAKLTFTQPTGNKVKVTIGATKGFEKRSVTYQVICLKETNDCKITEIFERGKLFTKDKSKCLDDFYRTEIKKQRHK